MEINQRMSKRFAWLLGVVVLVSIGLLVACGSKYNSSSDGLVLVSSQGSGLIETFSFNLGSGSATPVSNSPADTSGKTCVLNGIPSSVVVDPKGTYAYTIINKNTSCDTTSPPFTSTNGILAFKLNSDGTTTVVGKPVLFNAETVVFQGTTTQDAAVPVVPGTMTIDSAGKFLFVADRATTDSTGLYIPGAVSVFAIGSGGSVTEVAGSPFFVSLPASTLPQAGLDIVSVAATPTVFPAIGINGVQNSVCSNQTPPTLEYLYAVDRLGYQLFEFSVETTTGVLTLVTNQTMPVATDKVPTGIAVDPCDRFVYVSDSLTDKISAYNICSGISPICPAADGSLIAVSGSPFSITGANTPGPLVVDPYGNFVYVLGTLSNTVHPLKISPVSGSLSAGNPASVATGQGPTSIAIRGDDNWLFVTNFNSPSVSQYAVTPATGALTAQQTIATDNYPWGVAVK
jgi:6-phosphogluconolactonase (cycloisomerase 2 family)